MAQGKLPRSTSWNGKTRERCQFDKCNKRAKDFHEGKWLCRIHSPMREGHERKKKKIWIKD